MFARSTLVVLSLFAGTVCAAPTTSSAVGPEALSPHGKCAVEVISNSGHALAIGGEPGGEMIFRGAAGGHQDVTKLLSSLSKCGAAPNLRFMQARRTGNGYDIEGSFIDSLPRRPAQRVTGA